MTDYLKEFIERKLNLAHALSNGELGGTYSDAILIISSILSSFASELWPGTGIDKFRFVELWVNNAPCQLSPCLISLPLLIDSLRAQGDTFAVNVLEGTNRNAFCGIPQIDTLVITGTEIDRDEATIINLCPHLRRDFLRRHAYPYIFYKQVRSGYVHEYTIGAYASSHPMSDDKSCVSYVNYLDPPHRRIYFPIAWLVQLTQGISKSFASARAHAPFPIPSSWWLQG